MEMGILIVVVILVVLYFVDFAVKKTDKDNEADANPSASQSPVVTPDTGKSSKPGQIIP